MELESLKVLIETETDASKLKEYESALQDLKATYDDMRQIGDNGYLKAKNMFGDDYANKLNAYKKGIADLESKIANINNQPSTSKGLLSNLDLKGMVGSISKITLALAGVRTIFSAITKAMNAYLNQNEELKGKINALWLALGTAFAPILETLVNLAVKLVAYINVFVQALGFAGINLKKISSTSEKIKKSLAGIDEITNIGSNQSESGFQNPFADVQLNEDWIEFLQTVANLLLWIRDIVVWILNLLNPVLDFFQNAFNAIFTNLINGISQIQDAIMNSDMPTWLKNSLNFILDTIRVVLEAIRGLIDGLFTGIKSVLNGIINVLKGNFTLGFKQIINGLLTIFESFINFCIKGINALLAPLRDLGNDILGLLGISSFSFKSIPTVKLPRLATGTNYVPQDMVAMLHEGEAVVPKKYNPYDMYGNVSAEQLSLLASINDLLTQINGKNFDVSLDGQSLATSIKNINEANVRRNGTSVFALSR